MVASVQGHEFDSAVAKTLGIEPADLEIGSKHWLEFTASCGLAEAPADPVLAGPQHFGQAAIHDRHRP